MAQAERATAAEAAAEEAHAAERALKLMIFSWNMGDAPPNAEEHSEWLPEGGGEGSARRARPQWNLRSCWERKRVSS